MDEDIKPKQPVPIDPDNPPLTGKEKWGRWGDRVAAKIRAFDERVAARKKAGQTQPPIVDNAVK